MGKKGILGNVLCSAGPFSIQKCVANSHVFLRGSVESGRTSKQQLVLESGG